MVNWISAFWLPPAPKVETARTPVRRLAIPSFGRHRIAHLVHDLELSAIAPVDISQPHEDRAEVLRPRWIVADRGQREIDFGNLPHPRRDPVGKDLGRFEARPLGSPEADLELGLIVLGEEVLVRQHEERNAAQQDEHRHPGDHPAMPSDHCRTFV